MTIQFDDLLDNSSKVSDSRNILWNLRFELVQILQLVQILTKPVPYFQALIFWLLGGGPAGDPGWVIFAQVHTLYSKILSIICLSLILGIIYIRFRQFDIYLIGFLVYIVAISFYWVLYTHI